MKSPALVLLLFAACAVAHAQPFPEPRVVHINDRVHVLLGPIQHANASNQGYMINSTVTFRVEVRKSLDLSAWEKLGRAYVIGRNVNRAYLELEPEGFDD